MMKNILFFLIAAPLFFSACKVENKTNPKTADSAPLIDMEDFFRNGDKTTFRISPDGKYYSYRADYKGKSNLFVQKVGDTAAVRVTQDTLRTIFIYFWKNNRIVFAQDTGGDENYQLFSVKPDGTDLIALTPFPQVRTMTMDPLYNVPGKEDQLFILMNKRTPEYFDPYLLNVETGKIELLYDNKENYTDWIIDNSGAIRMALQTDGVNMTWFYRNSEKDPFESLMTTNFRESFVPSGFDKDNKIIYALSNLGRDKSVLVEYDPLTKKEIKELYSDSEYDLSSIEYDRNKQTLRAVHWEAEKPSVHYFDSEWKNRMGKISKDFPGQRVEMVSYDNARTKGIVRAESDINPGKFYLYDFDSGKLEEIANPYHWINPEQMSVMKPISYKSRDGLTIHGYLTLPLGVEAKKLPVIINPHGGPWHRDTWFYNPEVQFLTNRGYGVLQINFRGSTGYGRKFWEAGFKEWGKKMQDDITDGVHWLIEQGIADPSKIGIYGASYGGYATLAGITFTPDLYAAAVDYVGVSNLFTFYKTIPPYWKSYMDSMMEMVGDPVKDSLLMAEASPALQADKIKTPLFIAQGANDPRVNKAESDQMVEAMKNRGVEVEYMVKEDEGHGFYNQENQYDFYRAMERFFRKHLMERK